MKRKYKILILFGLLLLSAILLPSCQIGRYIYYNFADIQDHKIFPARHLTTANAKFQFHENQNGKFPTTINGKPINQFLEESKTVAFLVIKNDSILYEKYFAGYEKNSIVPSFSMAKSVTSILIGCAIDDGLIKNENELVTQYIPELSKNGFEKVTIKHLLQMTSGLDFNESYFNPFGHAASFYYGLNLRKSSKKLKLKNEPGKQFEYVSGNSQLLGWVLERALKGKNITTYLQEKIWTPLGMEYDASWSLDQEDKGIEKTFCCLNARARDFAKIGRLYKNKGNWNGSQIVSEEWVKKSTQLDTTEGSADFYQYQWWLPTPGEDFMAQGILGQYVYVHPTKDIIIVRLGKNYGNVNWKSVFPKLAKMYKD